jgi:uncharacterized protein (UPF0261 family)
MVVFRGMETNKTIALIGTLDTKGEEIGYLKSEIKRQGFKAIVIDVGVLGKPLFEADVSRAEVAKSGGIPLSKLIQRAKRGVEKETAVRIMSLGVKNIVQKLCESGEIDGVIAIGGAIGTAIGTNVMKALPYGFPKLMVSIILAGRLKQFVDSKDIMFMNYPTDILGLNFLTRRTLSNSSAALAGMLRNKEFFETPRKLVAITSLGVTTVAVLWAKSMIENLGYETVIYTIDTEGIDDLLRNELIYGILDLTPCELVKIHITQKSNNINRLSIAYNKGVPQILAPGGLDFIILPCSINDVPKKYSKRMLYKHSPYVTLVRVNKREAILLGKKMAEIANKSRGPIAIAVPLKGFSAIDKEGQLFYDNEIDNQFLKSLKKNLGEQVKLFEIDAHINEKRFVSALIEVFQNLLSGQTAIKSLKN